MQVIVFFTILKSMILFKEFANHAFSTIRTTTAAVSPSCLNSSQIEACFGKEELVEILTNAEVPLDHDRCNRLPTWRAMTDLYGEKQIVLGLETCQAYRDMIQTTAGATPMPRIAGLCNSGTNVLNQLLFRNLGNITHVGAPRQGYQVPWGKHAQAKHRLTNIFQNTVENATWVLPIVLIRDPYRWMQSMCRNPYAATWAKTDHCPNIMLSQKNHRTMFHNTSSLSFQSQPSQRTPSRQSRSTVPVTVRYTNHVMTHHSSLIHWWNEWYQLYLSNVTYPRIIVRYEDLLFYGQQVTEAICHCGGGIPRHRHRRSDGNDPMINQSQPTNDYDFVHWRMSAKQHHYLYMDNSHGNNSDHPNISSNNNNNHQQQHHLTDLVTAMIQYGQNDQHRTDGMILEDVQAAMELLDPILMKTFGYDHPFLKQVTPHHE